MQSITAFFSRSLSLFPSIRTRALAFARAYTTTARTADPAVHSEDPQDEEGDEAAKAAADEKNQQQSPQFSQAPKKPPESDKTPPFAPSPKLESSETGPPVHPILQQKRRWSHNAPSHQVLNDVACVGFDGTPVPEEEEGETETELKKYYEEHKPSPLSEVEFADSRLPISRATDGEKRDDLWGGEGRGYLVEDTVDDSLRRAEEMWKAARERGDPDSPQSRALARMLRERHQQSGGDLYL